MGKVERVRKKEDGEYCVEEPLVTSSRPPCCIAASCSPAMVYTHINTHIHSL